MVRAEEDSWEDDDSDVQGATGGGGGDGAAVGARARRVRRRPAESHDARRGEGPSGV